MSLFEQKGAEISSLLFAAIRKKIVLIFCDSHNIIKELKINYSSKILLT